MTLTDYTDALQEISDLCQLDPAPNSPEGQYLLELTAIVEDYEREHFPEYFVSIE